MNYVFLDLETTGLNPAESEILQIAYIITDPNGNNLRERNSFIYYDKSFRQKIDDFPHNVVKYSDCEKGVPLEQAVEEFIQDTKELNVTVFLAYNVEFEVRFLNHFLPDEKKEYFNRLKHECIMKQAKDYFGKRMKLTAVFEKLFNSSFIAHNAENDIKASKDIYYAIKEKISPCQKQINLFGI